MATPDVNPDSILNLNSGAASAMGSGLGQVQQAIGYQQQLQNQQLQQQQLQQQLQDAQYKTVTGTTQTAMNMSDPIFKVSEKAMEKRLQQANPDYKAGTLAAMRSDPDLRAGVQAYQQAVLTGKIPADDAHKQMVLAAFGDPGQAENLIKTFNEQRQLENSQAIKTAAIQSQQSIAQQKNETSRANNQDSNATKLQTAGMINGAGSPRVVRTQEAINSGYERAIKPYEQTVNAVDQLKSTLADIDSGKLSDAKNVKAEIESKMASVFGGGKPSTVFGQQAVGLDSLYGDYENLINHTLGEAHGVLTPAQKAQIHQELKTFGDNAAKQHEDAYLKFAAGHENLPEQYTQGVHANYSKYRQQKGLSDVNNGGAVQAPVPNSAAAGEANKQQQPSPNQQAFIAKAQKLVNPKTGQPYDMQTIQQMIQAKGIK